MNYPKLALSELFADPFFSTLGSQAMALVRTGDRARLKPTGHAGWRSSEIPVTVIKNGEALSIRCEVPGAKIEDISVSVDGDRVEISARRHATYEGKVLRSERWSGESRRILQLPFAVDGERVDAHYGKGVLTVTLTPAPKQGEKKIQITRKEDAKV